MSTIFVLLTFGNSLKRSGCLESFNITKKSSAFYFFAFFFFLFLKYDAVFGISEMS